MTKDDAKSRIGIPADHDLIETDTTWGTKGGQDTDTYWYDEVNAEGAVVNKYVLYDSTAMHPPFGRSIHWEKV